MRSRIGFAALVLSVCFLVASNAKADFVAYTDAGAAQNAGLVELFTITITGLPPSVPETGCIPTVSFASEGVAGWVWGDGRWNPTTSGGFTLGFGTRITGQYVGYGFAFDIGELLAGFESMSIEGYAVSGVWYTGDDLRNLVITENGGSYEAWYGRTETRAAGITTNQTFHDRPYSFTVTYYGYATPIVVVPPNDVPEPATLALVGLGLAGLGLARRRK